MTTLHCPVCQQVTEHEQMLDALIAMAEHMEAIDDADHEDQLPVIAGEIRRHTRNAYCCVSIFDAWLGKQTEIVLYLAGKLFSLRSDIKNNPDIGVRESNRIATFRRMLEDALLVAKRTIR